MTEYTGKGVYPGTSIGKIHIFNKAGRPVELVHISDAKAEISRYTQAVEKVTLQLKNLYDKAVKEVGQENAAIFEIHQMLLVDEEFTSSICNLIEIEEVNAEYAIDQTCQNLVKLFEAMDDEYMAARASDIKDISKQLISVLCNDSRANEMPSEPFILLAQDLTPSETIKLDKSMILSFVTVEGSANSHAAILAKSLGIPSLVGASLPLKQELEGKTAIVDGTNGRIIIDPAPEILQEMQEALADEKKQKNDLNKLKGQSTITKDGKAIKLYANIGSLDDLTSVIENDAQGIGLFRSEFIYLGRDSFPTEDEQFEIYKTSLEKMKGQEVIIRTLDIGADKQCHYFNLDKEANPALGYRAIRICLMEPEIFKTQLRALFRAGVYGNLSVMYPMITSMKEIAQIKKLELEVVAELEAQGLAYKLPSRGIMIETPAAVMISNELAKEVDFFSIGTNDLTQYTLAIDRVNSKLDSFFDSHHPAILAMIKMVVDNAHSNGIWAGICGELAADTSLTNDFIEMGIDELSVSPAYILPIRSIIKNQRD